MSNPQYPYRLLTPGPVPLHPEVQKILAEPMIHHRTPLFEQVFQRVTQNLKDAFSTKNEVFIHASTGSGAMESAIVNTLSPGDQVLCVVSGKFGERWAKMAENYGLNVTTLDVEWGHAVNPAQVQKALLKNPAIKAVLTQACETSTATLHPIWELAKITRDKETLLLVDAITAVGATELEMDAWGVDVVIGGSQKAFMLPAGLSFIALSDKAWDFHKRSTLPKFYWNLTGEKQALGKGESQFSSVVPLIRALDFTLKLLTGDGKKKTLARIQSLAEKTRATAEPLGFQIFSKSPSPSVTALVVPNGLDGQKMRDHIEKNYNMTLMGGQDRLKGKILRIGHLGYITDDDMKACFEILKQTLHDFGYKRE